MTSIDLHFQIIREKLEKICAVASKAKAAEESLNEVDKDYSIIAILGLIEDLSSDFSSVYAIENILQKMKGI